jgi:hypothetical protein
MLRFNKAYIHQSDGRPGIDDGTGWVQEIGLELTGSEIFKLPISMPEELVGGHILVNGELHDNGIKLPLKETGDIEIYLQTGMNEELRINAKSILSIEYGEMEYVEEFKA